jgi:eukaryotic-like serine/threonine-protein kinase
MGSPPDGTVTFLFTDLESSTQLVRLLGDRYPKLLSDHGRLVRDAIAEFGGYEVDTQGDAFFAAFARAGDAVSAALSAQRKLAQYSWPEGVPVRVRMGLHTGQPLLVDGRYVGLDVHRAARITAAAHGGQIVLSRATAGLVRDSLGEQVELRNLGQQSLKDFVEPERLYQLLAEDLPKQFPPLRTGLPQIDDNASRRLRPVRFVDRSRERTALAARLTDTLAGQGGLLLISGEPGIGKTRLAEELAFEARKRGVATLWGRCWENAGAPAFWPWIQMLRQLVENRPPLALRAELGAGAAFIADIVPEVRQWLAEPAPPTHVVPEEARFHLFDAITRFLTNAAQFEPLLLVLDDVHWADTASLLLLQFLLQHLSQARLLLLGTYRDTEVGRGHPLAEVLPSFRRERGFELLRLKGLEEDAVEELVTSFFDGTQDPRAKLLARVLTQETEGNPFFVQEELRYLVENERIVLREGRWDSDVTTVAELELPEAVREVIDRRLTRLPSPSKRLLGEAAVIGREFDVATLEPLEGMGKRELDAALNEAASARIVDEIPGQSRHYRFTHVLFQEALYAGLPSRRRQRLHKRVGEVLEQRYGRDPGQHVSELAYHFCRAGRDGDLEKAIAYSERAGRQALTTYAYEEAVRHFETALRMQQPKQPAKDRIRCDLLLDLAEALSGSGGLRRVVDEVAPDALQLAETCADRERAFRACRAAIEALLRFANQAATTTDEFRTWLDRAARYARPGSPDALWVDMRLQFAQGRLGYPGRTWAARLRSLERARGLGDENFLCLALNSLLATGTPRQWPEQVRWARQYQDHPWQGVAIPQRAAFSIYCAHKLLDAGDRHGWERQHARIRGLAERTRDPNPIFWTLRHQHDRLYLDGALEEDLALLERLVEQAQGAGMRAAGLSSSAQWGVRTRIVLGRASANLTLLENRRTDLRLPVDAYDAMVLCQAHLGHREEVCEALTWLLSPEGALGKRDLSDVIQYLEAAVLIGHRDATAALAKVLSPARDAATCAAFALTCAARHLSAAAALLGRRRQAMTYARQALAVSSRIGNRPEMALAHLQLAELACNGSGSSDVRQARGWQGRVRNRSTREHLDLAIAEFTSMKMHPSLERALALQGRLPSMNSPTEDSSR